MNKKIKKTNKKKDKLNRINNFFSKEIVFAYILLIIYGVGVTIYFLINDIEEVYLVYGLIMWGLFYAIIPVGLFYMAIKNFKIFLNNNDKSKLKKAKIFEIISLVIYIFYIIILFGTEFVSLTLKLYFLLIFYTICIIIPNIIHLIICFRVNNK